MISVDSGGPCGLCPGGVGVCGVCVGDGGCSIYMCYGSEYSSCNVLHLIEVSKFRNV